MDQPQTHVQRLDLAARLAEAEEQQRAGAIASLVGADLNVNLVRLMPDESLEAHINAEVDVLLVGIAGAGAVELDVGDESLDADLDGLVHLVRRDDAGDRAPLVSVDNLFGFWLLRFRGHFDLPTNR